MGSNSLFYSAKMYLLVLRSILLIVLLSSVEASTRRHIGPRRGQREKIVHGRTMTKSPQSGGYAGQRGNVGDGLPHLVDFSCHIKRDIVVWDELVKDGITLDQCRFKPGERRSRIRLSGANLDYFDFEPGVIFVIEKGDFELGCGKELDSVPGIDDSDNILFYKIIRRRIIDPQTIILNLKLVPGRNVVPVIDISISKDPAPPMLEDFYIFEDDDMSGSSGRVISPMFENSTLPATDRVSKSFMKTVTVASGVTFGVNAVVDVRFTNFKVVRLLSLEFRWEQSLDASLQASLTINAAYKDNKSGGIARAFIPGLSFGVGIPLVGKLEAGAFVAVNWIVELEATVQATLKFNANYKRHEEVTASILSPSYNAVNKLPFGSGASSSASLTLGAAATVRFQGFGGIRPLVGVSLKYTRRKFKIFPPKTYTETKSVDGAVGADIGLQLTTTFTTPPFQPFTGKELNSICDNCHNIRANLRFIGKRLSAQLIIGGEVKGEKVIVSTLFDLDIGTLCFLPQTCPTIRALHE